jgi:geranylgeranyl pyrophosphate synthase
MVKGAPEEFKEIRQRFIDSEAFIKTKEDVKYYIQRARRSINTLSDSCFKESLFVLADYIVVRLYSPQVGKL